MTIQISDLDQDKIIGKKTNMFCIGVVQSVEVRTKNLRFLPNILAIVEKLMILHLILGLFPILVEKRVRKICSQNVDINV